MTSSFLPDSTYFQSKIQEPLLQVSIEALIVEVIQAMSQARTSYALVENQQQLVGIFTERDLVKAIALGVPLEHQTIATVMTTKVITIHAAKVENIFTVLHQFRQHQIRHLPVVDDQARVIGVITPQDVREVLQPTDLLRLRQVAEVMTAQVCHAVSTASVAQLVQMMAIQQISCVVIVAFGKESDGPPQPIGIVTERDIVRLKSMGLDFSQTLAQEVMSTPLLSIQAKDSLWEAHQRMQQQRIRRLVVTNAQQELVGIITQTNIVRRSPR
jgi:CBS domain-containing protein